MSNRSNSREANRRRAGVTTDSKGSLRSLITRVLMNVVDSFRGADPVAVEMEESVEWCVVLGCAVRAGGVPSDMLADRVDRAISLIVGGQAKRLLMSGDGASATGFDETAVMREWAIAAGVPADRIVCDPSGVSTFASMQRAAAVVGIRPCAVVTQAFHVPRTAYLAATLLPNAMVIPCDGARRYGRRLRVRLALREIPALLKACLELRFRRR